MKRKITLLLMVMMAALALTGVVAAQEEAPTQTRATTIMDVVRSDERLTTLKTLTQAAVLADNLNEDGPFTVFAPTNEAFAAFEAMAEESGLDLTDVLLYHVVNGNYNAAALAGRTSLPTLQGERLYFTSSNGTMTVNQMATVSIADIQTSNGVIHIIDHVLLPSAFQQGDPGATIMDVLAEDGRFETLISLLNTADLADMLNSRGDTFTLFAPTDEAFAAAPEALLDKWTADPEGELRTILSYHVIGDAVHSDQIANDDFIPTWEGRALRVNYSDALGVRLNGHSVVTPDIQAANGVIHAVDSVLIP